MNDIFKEYKKDLEREKGILKLMNIFNKLIKYK